MSVNGREEIERLERAFWDSMISGRPEIATNMLTEPALMVGSHGTSKFDHEGYAKMASEGSWKLLSYEMTDFDVLFPRDDVAVASYRVSQDVAMGGKVDKTTMFDSSTWTRIDSEWRCVSHTESPAQAAAP